MQKIVTKYIALSASFYDDPEVQKILHQCEHIYTTQRKYIDKMEAIFGKKVFALPYSPDSFLNHLKVYVRESLGVRVNAIFITYSDLFAVHNGKKKVEEVLS